MSTIMDTAPVFGREGEIHLAARIAQGGQGSVFRVAGRPTQLAKLYHHAPALEQAEKLAHMTSTRQPALAALGAWPIELLHDVEGALRGFLMPAFDGHLPLHMAYDGTTRATHFARADWRWLRLGPGPSSCSTTSKAHCADF
jgi:DNA-binding helix-hairpin-helix protein with protein kinase domain